MRNVSATIITLNEEKDIARAIESVMWADEIVVVDAGSTDKTVEIARNYTQNVVHRDWTGFVDQKNYASSIASFDWIFSIDADEECSLDLKDEILKWKKSDSTIEAAFRIPRMSFFLGQWIRHTNWYPNYQIRLFDKNRAFWGGGQVHETVSAEGVIGTFKGHILHYTYTNLSDFLEKMESYSTLGAHDLYNKGKRVSVQGLIISPWVAFIKSYIFKKGFLDGKVGAIVAGLTFMSKFYKYAKLYELSLKEEKSNKD